MKSFCIKSNNKKINNYLLKNFKTYNLNHFYISNRKFKIYNNIILHCADKNTTFFYDCFCNVLTDTIIKFYEKNELKKIITLNYFYFSEIEQSIILKDCINFFNNTDNPESLDRKDVIYIALLKYINENKFFILDGFVHFRLKEYKKILEYVVDTCVNNFIVEKEYNEFVSLLRIYINSKKSNSNIVHLLYKNHSCTLLDDDYNVIPTNKFSLDATYLSDITFSSNDYALNTLLNLLPKKLKIHLIDDSDEFIETLRLIFEKNVSICKHCSLCTKYKLLNEV